MPAAHSCAYILMEEPNSKLRDSGKDTEMDKEMIAKLKELLLANVKPAAGINGKRCLTPEETESVVGGKWETFTIWGMSISRSDLNAWVEGIQKYYGRDVALDIVYEAAHSVGYHDETRLEKLYDVYGPSEDFWDMVERPGF